MNKQKISIVLGIVCLLLTLGIVVQMRTISSTITISDPTYVDDGLRDELLRLQERYEEKYKELETAEINLEKKRTEATTNDTTSNDKKNELQKGEAVLGTSEVSGKGIIITLNDNQSVSTETLGITEDVSTYIVHEEDLLNVVNELKNAGAEAISINDQRIISTSSIICAGNIVRVNGNRVGAPFVIKAIGNQSDLYYALTRVGGYIDILNSWNIITNVEKPTKNITIVKYSGIMKPKYMKETN